MEPNAKLKKLARSIKNLPTFDLTIIGVCIKTNVKIKIFHILYNRFLKSFDFWKKCGTYSELKRSFKFIRVEFYKVNIFRAFFTSLNLN